MTYRRNLYDSCDYSYAQVNPVAFAAVKGTPADSKSQQDLYYKYDGYDGLRSILNKSVSCSCCMNRMQTHTDELSAKGTHFRAPKTLSHKTKDDNGDPDPVGFVVQSL